MARWETLTIISSLPQPKGSSPKPHERNLEASNNEVLGLRVCDFHTNYGKTMPL